jgi:hypothetical protein
MSLTTIAVFAAAYVAVLVVVMALLTSARRADVHAQREHEALVRSLTPRTSGRFAGREDRIAEPTPERTALRRIG